MDPRMLGFKGVLQHLDSLLDRAFRSAHSTGSGGRRERQECDEHSTDAGDRPGRRGAGAEAVLNGPVGGDGRNCAEDCDADGLSHLSGGAGKGGGDADPTVPVQGTRDLVAALRAANGKVRYDEIPGGAHDVWTRTYAQDVFWDWLLAQKR